MRLSRNFFNRSTVTVAKDLLGKYLVRRIGGKVTMARITETEAYCGVKDKANHASKGLTPRTKVMFGPPGHAYIYLIYGMYHCFNIVTEKEGYPAAVLIRMASITNYAVRIKGKNLNPVILNTNPIIRLKGPGILCRELKIDRTLNGIDVCRGGELWVEEGELVSKSKIKRAKRIGVDYAGKWKDKLWRFSI